MVWSIHQEGGSTFVIKGALACGSARQTMPAIRINIDAQVALRAPDARLTAQRRILIRRLLILEPPHVTDQQADLSARQLFPKCRHAAFATTHDRNQASGGCDAG